jgi:hypothetical protein
MANKVSSNGKDDLGNAYSDGQGRGQMGYGAQDAGGVHKRRSGFEIGNAYRGNQASGVRGYARGATKLSEGGEGRLGGGSSKGQPDW